jgi:hypothetical protein
MAVDACSLPEVIACVVDETDVPGVRVGFDIATGKKKRTL